MNGSRSGRSMDGEHRRNRTILLSQTDLCALCGHYGAKTADHIITWTAWPKGPDGRALPGFNALPNLQPAHGTMGNRLTGTLNPCPVCGQLCNQVRKDRPLAPAARSEDW